jgi:hypothetical protein
MTIRRGAGTVVELGDTETPGVGTVYAAIPSIRNFRLQGQSGEQEITALDSTAKEFMRDLPDYGRATMQIFYRPGVATQDDVTGLEALFNNGQTRAFRVRPNSHTKRFTCAAFVMSRDINFDPNQPMEMTVELRITGPIVWANVA